MNLLHVLSANPIAFQLFMLFMGLAVGSFLNLVIHRVPLMLHREWKNQCHEFLGHEDASTADKKTFNLIWPRSHCPQCEHQISVWENIPVLSYLFLRAKCSGCHNKISFRYPFVEILTALLSVFLAWHFGFTFTTIAALVFTWSLLTMTFIDIDHQLLPDNMTLPMLWLGLVLSVFGVFTNPVDAIIGAVAGYLSLWSVAQLFKLVTGKEGMGYGDFKLLALLGAWLGWQMLPFIILCSSFVGAFLGILILMFQGKDKSTPIPFGPYLAISGWVAMLWGWPLTTLYLQFAGF